jgi:hypothetical protein
MFRTFSQKGFQVSFDNGLTVSVMFGAGNYCEYRFSDIEDIEDNVVFGGTVKVWSEHNSVSAEIAVIDSNGNFVTEFPGCPEGDQVRGWITPDEMLAVMNWAAAQ